MSDSASPCENSAPAHPPGPGSSGVTSLDGESAAGPTSCTGDSALRFLWGLAGTGLALLYTALLAPFAAAVAPYRDGRLATSIARLWSWLIIRTCGVSVRLEGLEHLNGIDAAVLVSNHQSFFDIWALFAYFPREIRFVAKRELLKIPLVGYAMRRSGHIVVNRQKGGQAVRQAIRATRLGFSIVFFAEGRRYNNNRVNSFNEGAAWLAITAGVPCVPIAISGSGAIFPKGAKIPRPGREIIIRLGPPISTRGLKSSDRGELTRKLEAAVRSLYVPCPDATT